MELGGTGSSAGDDLSLSNSSRKAEPGDIARPLLWGVPTRAVSIQLLSNVRSCFVSKEIGTLNSVTLVLLLCFCPFHEQKPKKTPKL